MTAAATRVLFDEPGPRGRARIRIATVVGLLLVAGLVALALYQFYKNGQLGRSRWLAFAQPAYLGFLAEGIRGTIIATVLAAVLSFPLGVVLALGRLSRNGVLRRVSTWYIELFRSIPLLLLIYAFLLALPRYGINLPILWKLVVRSPWSTSRCWPRSSGRASSWWTRASPRPRRLSACGRARRCGR